MLQPAIRTEKDDVLGHLGTQLDAIRNAAFGLTEEQARQTPTRSALSIGGLLKHTTYGMAGATARIKENGRVPTPEEFQASVGKFMASFALAEDETLEGALSAFDSARVAYLEALAGLDPDAESVEPPAPWEGRFEPAAIRWRFYMLHQLEEMARHAGHADIIREQLDGAQAGSLQLAVDGQPDNDFTKAWRPGQQA